ncbi:MAG: acetyl-CoA carboxylase biotin carboxyl carrier protein subunit [Patescibacteria group bacterium]|nr:acetyl-CoA carboxylase biotin carboxyl carrier protein subunit [Patescibacteria group bacterium]
MIVHFPLLKEAKILVKTGDKIDFNTPLFNINLKKEFIINIAEKLSIRPEKIFSYLKKLVAEKIKKDEVLAEKKSLLSSIIVKSPVSGIIKEINHNHGTIVIEITSEEKNQFLSPFKGIIEEIKNDFLKIKLNKAHSFDLKEKSKIDFGGEIFLFKSSDFFNIKTDDIENKIIVVEKLSSFEQIKLEALGAKGFITIETLPEKTEIPSFRLKNIEDIKKIFKEKFMYCTIINNSDKIYFYL